MSDVKLSVKDDKGKITELNCSSSEVGVNVGGIKKRYDAGLIALKDCSERLSSFGVFKIVKSEIDGVSLPVDTTVFISDDTALKFGDSDYLMRVIG